jgi:Zn-dependent protease
LESLERFLLLAPVLLFSMVAHEYAHGFAALTQGDPTARDLGRLTWNPLRHIDPFLTIGMPLMTFYFSGGSFIFGGAKPVPVDPRNYRTLRRSDIIVSLAGIAVNLVLVVLLVGAIIALGLIGRAVPDLASPIGILQQMFRYGVFFNLLLAVFNLLPVPPLDGSHVAKYLLPPAWALQYQRIAGYGFLVLILLLTIARPVLDWWLAPVWALDGAALRLIHPYVMPSPLTS